MTSAHAVLDPRPTPPVIARAHLPARDTVRDVLSRASNEHWRVAVVGGSPAQLEPLHRRFIAEWPGLALVGHWTPMRAALSSPLVSHDIAAQIRHTDADLVIVCLGAPRQREWIDSYGDATGAGAVLAVDAIDDLLTARAGRAHTESVRPRLDRMWRLMLEPKRSAKRCLVEEPPAHPAVRRSSARPDA
ncbi:WecB/TagA/CpsF family glycosyltransferase [Microbacterium oleivorans]|uniref:WecB/TagA/CpsF family glycosyltransferase n=1 Tax=Microbacterium TaxID=33882 RepID=UPI0020415FBF|nr:WecB/TagA/CpsF family glycosyltransferase [Microbacterium oleivorans]MCM3695305.1 WecB/TagA/CpsF family glycosyltransferase [Microbacterium oleivorans]